MTPINNKNNKDTVKLNMDWNKSYYLDIDLIDKQHAIFFRIFDEIKELNKTPDSYDKLKDLILELEKYTNIHFRTEEALLLNSKHQGLNAHITQHQTFKKKIEEFKIAETYHNSLLTEQMIVFMRKWFLIHIAEVDREYVEDVKSFLKERKSAKTPN